MRLRDVICLAIGHRWTYVGECASRDKWICARCGAVSVDYLPRMREYVEDLEQER